MRESQPASGDTQQDRPSGLAVLPGSQVSKSCGSFPLQTSGMGFRVLSRPDPSIMSENLDPLAGRIGEERVSDKTPIARQHGSSAPDSNFMTSPLIVTPRTTVASTSSNRSQVSYIETAFTNGLEVMETQGRQSANFGNDIRGNGVPHSNIGSVAHTVFEESFADSDQEESTGSQTPRRREGAATGFGFSLMRPPSNTPGKLKAISSIALII